MWDEFRKHSFGYRETLSYALTSIVLVQLRSETNKFIKDAANMLTSLPGMKISPIYMEGRRFLLSTRKVVNVQIGMQILHVNNGGVLGWKVLPLLIFCF